MPPASTVVASPSRIRWAPWMIDSKPEPQSRLTVRAGTSFGTPPSGRRGGRRRSRRPRSAARCRRSTWSISRRLDPAAAQGLRAACTPRSMAETSEKAPLYSAIGVRAPSRMTMSVDRSHEAGESTSGKRLDGARWKRWRTSLNGISRTSGWMRLVSRMAIRSRSGSIQTEVPGEPGVAEARRRHLRDRGARAAVALPGQAARLRELRRPVGVRNRLGRDRARAAPAPRRRAPSRRGPRGPRLRRAGTRFRRGPLRRRRRPGSARRRARAPPSSPARSGRPSPWPPPTRRGARQKARAASPPGPATSSANDAVERARRRTLRGSSVSEEEVQVAVDHPLSRRGLGLDLRERPPIGRGALSPRVHRIPGRRGPRCGSGGARA